jgi:Protein of unknown function (DUF2785)
MRPSLVFLATFLFLISAQPATRAALPQTSASHDRTFWRNIIKNNYRVPPYQSVFPLVQELSSYLGSPDPELRDDIAYTLINAWIAYQKQLSPQEVIPFADEWQSNLRIGIGETNTDSALLRSFSALCLGAIAERDLKTPFLGVTRYRLLLNNAVNYLRDEQDLRAFDPVKGWIHATAHTADLLHFLAANPLFTVEDQRRTLQAISQRLSSANLIYTYGEQDRLAVTTLAIISRVDFDAAFFQTWITTMEATDRNVWKSSPPNDHLLKTFQNDNYFLESLAARLCAEPKSATITTALDLVTQILRKR